jgi:hypothetical protein
VPCKHHVDGDEEQQDATRRAKGRNGDPKDAEDGVAEHAEDEKDAGRNEDAARCDGKALRLGVVLGQCREDEGDVGNAHRREQRGDSHEEGVEHPVPWCVTLQSLVAGG